jgi:hypothetical protein
VTFWVDALHVEARESAIYEQRDEVLAAAGEVALPTDVATWMAGVAYGVAIANWQTISILRQHFVDAPNGGATKLPDNLIKKLRLVKAGMPWDVVCALSGLDILIALEALASEERRLTAISKGDPDEIVARPLGGETTTFRKA